VAGWSRASVAVDEGHGLLGHSVVVTERYTRICPSSALRSAAERGEPNHDPRRRRRLVRGAGGRTGDGHAKITALVTIGNHSSHIGRGGCAQTRDVAAALDFRRITSESNQTSRRAELGRHSASLRGMEGATHPGGRGAPGTRTRFEYVAAPKRHHDSQTGGDVTTAAFFSLRSAFLTRSCPGARFT
jgi:hypothetical protein